MKISEMKGIGRRIDEGAWIDDLPNLPGVRLKVRGIGNSSYNRLLQQIRGQVSAEVWRDEEFQEDLEIKLLSQTVLIDWDGIDDIPFSVEAAVDLLGDPDLQVFRRAVNFAASVVAREGQEKVEQASKNSKRRSGGK